jgi:HlyD family secretion protein
MTTDTSNLNTWTNTMNANVTSLNNLADTIDSSTRNIADKQEALIKLQAGTDALDLRSQELVVEQRQNALNDYYILAPFSGTIAKLEVKNNDSISGGSAIATLITDSKLADISLNEVDAAKVKVGQKATLTFDAIDGLSVAGEVSEVDLVGTVSQGVVSYNAKISFDTQDERIRSGMSVSADIAVDTRQDVLIVPSSAIKSSGGSSYVETFGDAVGVTDNQGVASKLTPTQTIVTTGKSDDTSTEILTGLKEGDKIITQTLAASATTKKVASITSLFSPSRTKTSGTTSGSKTSATKSSSARSGAGGPPAF